MEKSISRIDQDLEKTLGALQRYLQSEMSISEPFWVNAAGQGENYEAVTIKVKVTNTAPSREGWGEIVFVGVGLTLTCNGSDTLFQRLKSSLQPYPIRRWASLKERTLISAGNISSGVEETADSSYNPDTFGRTTLFPGESTTYDIELPLASLPFVSVSVTGIISPGNLFQCGQVFRDLEKLAKPVLATSTPY